MGIFEGSSVASPNRSPQEIYSEVKSWIFRLTTAADLGPADVQGMEIQGGVIDGHIRRILTTSWMPHGKYSAAYSESKGQGAPQPGTDGVELRERTQRLLKFIVL